MFARNTCRLTAPVVAYMKWPSATASHTGKRILIATVHSGPHYRLQHVRRGFHQKRSNVVDASGVRLLWKKLFGKYLLATNTISSGLLMVAGDLVAQEIEYRRGRNHHNDGPYRYDLKRVGRMFVVGALQGPMHHYVYNWMDKVMPVRNMRNTMWKILIDQVVMSPACIFLFFYSACCLECKTLKETNCELRDKFGYIYLFDWMVWPAAQYVNFSYLDTKYRVMFVNVCTALYNVFMSYMKHDFALDL